MVVVVVVVVVIVVLVVSHRASEVSDGRVEAVTMLMKVNGPLQPEELR